MGPGVWQKDQQLISNPVNTNANVLIDRGVALLLPNIVDSLASPYSFLVNGSYERANSRIIERSYSRRNAATHAVIYTVHPTVVAPDWAALYLRFDFRLSDFSNRITTKNR
jgi:Txe/YoeB family toxin of Txe-Axe toxin-antitoxin module